MTKSGAQLDREIAEALANGGKTPLYGHTSESTAYVVDDYPYGFRERTQIRFWLEHKPKKGWRFVSQTMNPKTGRWNKPKASTYLEWGGAMYLDEKGHVHWDGVGPYSDEKKDARVRADISRCRHERAAQGRAHEAAALAGTFERRRLHDDQQGSTTQVGG